MPQKSAKALASSILRQFSSDGVNKNQEITRLLYEISKREKISCAKIAKEIHSLDYAGIKKELLKRRYPYATSHSEPISPYLGRLELSADDEVDIKEKKFYPKNIFVEDVVSSSSLVLRVKELFPRAVFHRIESLKEYRREHGNFNIKDYNRRRDTVFIVNENYDFFKKCPCTKGAVGCGYHILNLGFGCPFECTYCFLQQYVNSTGIILPANLNDFFDRFGTYKKKDMRIGTGEFSDSLALDDATGYSLPIIEFFSGQKDVTFEFKTKSDKIDNVLKSPHGGNIVISWSLNPQKIINENEFYSASLKERLAAARSCVAAGYKAGFHFDPIIYFNGWEEEYERLIEELFACVQLKDVAWISMGTFRFCRELKQVIERRFPNNKILDEELLLGYDGKLRYPHLLRLDMYNKVREMFFKHSRKLNLYLCMEEAGIWRRLK